MDKVGRWHSVPNCWGLRERSFIYRYPNKLSCLIISDVDDVKPSCLIVFRLKKKENTCIYGSASRVEEKNLLAQLSSKDPFLILH
jgi:hypothetical protein